MRKLQTLVFYNNKMGEKIERCRKILTNIIGYAIISIIREKEWSYEELKN